MFYQRVDFFMQRGTPPDDLQTISLYVLVLCYPAQCILYRLKLNVMQDVSAPTMAEME
jgi:hypothetical protein